MESIVTHSPKETGEIARRLAETATAGLVIALDGDLGAGKTTFTKGFAEGLGIDAMVNSPTFVIVQEYYGGRLPLYHFDAYRIEEPEEMEEIGYREYVDGDGVCIIEWSNLIEEILPAERIDIRITRLDESGTDDRLIEIEDHR